MADPTPAELQSQIDWLKAQVAECKAQVAAVKIAPGFWEGLDTWMASHHKIAAALSGLLFAALTWATTYFSMPAKEVPGPEKVIYKDAPPPKAVVPEKKEPEKNEESLLKPSGPYNIKSIRPAFLRPTMNQSFERIEYAKAD